MKKNTQLLIIDPQNDFCDLPQAWLPQNPLEGGATLPSLPVPGAHEDMLQLASLIARMGPALDAITITLDSHHRLDIAHPAFWRSAEGQPVAPFTTISAAQVRAHQYLTARPENRARALQYLDELEYRGRYTLMVWPVHCEIGTWGQNIHAGVQAACADWEITRGRVTEIVHKGSNPWTEHYSAIQAEVPDEDDAASLSNLSLLSHLSTADTLLIAGLASSHCVKASTEHLVEQLPEAFRQRIVLLSDCMSPVSGFEAQADGFFSEMRKVGVRVMTSPEAMSLLAPLMA